MGVVLEASYTTGASWLAQAFGKSTNEYKLTQGFKLRSGQSAEVSSIKVIPRINGTPVSGNVYLEVRTDNGSGLPDTLVGTSVARPFSDFDANAGFDWYEFTFASPLSLSDNTQYHIGLYSDVLDASNYYQLRRTYITGIPSNGTYGDLTYDKVLSIKSDDSIYLTPANTDFCFQILGDWASPGATVILTASYNLGTGWSTSTYAIGRSTTYHKVGQGFKLNSGRQGTVSSLKVILTAIGSPVGDIYVDIVPDTGGGAPDMTSVLATSNAVDASTIGANPTYDQTTFTFASPIELSNDTQYYFVVRTTITDASNYLQIRRCSSCYGTADDVFGRLSSVDAWFHGTADASFQIFGTWEEFGEADDCVIHSFSDHIELPLISSIDNCYVEVFDDLEVPVQEADDCIVEVFSDEPIGLPFVSNCLVEVFADGLDLGTEVVSDCVVNVFSDNVETEGDPAAEDCYVEVYSEEAANDADPVGDDCYVEVYAEEIGDRTVVNDCYVDTFIDDITPILVAAAGVINMNVEFPIPDIEINACGRLDVELDLPDINVTGYRIDAASIEAEFSLPTIEMLGGARLEAEFPIPDIDFEGVKHFEGKLNNEFPLPDIVVEGLTTVIGRLQVSFPLPFVVIDGEVNILGSIIKEFPLPSISLDAIKGEYGEVESDFPLPDIQAEGFSSVTGEIEEDFMLPDIIMNGIVANRFDDIILQHERWKSY